MTWDDVIKASEEYIDMLMIRVLGLDSVDIKLKEMWQQKLALALCRHQEIFVLADMSPSGKYFDREETAS